ncbi:RNA polymerase sigma factor [Actinomadura rubrisoli]|uniref:RNA polymerase sigma factor n=1 Tax=Actinomadura rubrisoli TaxID=2530368 RepID=UPI0014050965|nr:RNA polymerase sigma factor [Actinomadura rubrisoli]
MHDERSRPPPGPAQGSPSAVQPQVPRWFSDLYPSEFRALVKVALVKGATLDEAQDAAQATLTELLTHVMAGRLIAHPRAWARKALWSNFIGPRERDRRHLRRMIEGGCAVAEAETHDALSVWEDEQAIEPLLALLTPAQREVMDCVLDGLGTAEIGELLGKKPATIRKNLQLARDKLKPLLNHEPASPPPDPGEEDTL